MKTSVAFLFIVSGLLPAAPAVAASPAYCALYAREYAAARIGTAAGDQAAGALQRVEDQAYYRCLNLDEEPEFPTTSAYFGTDVEETDVATGGPFQEISEGDSAGDVPDEPVAPRAKPVVVPAKLVVAPAKVMVAPAKQPAAKPVRIADMAAVPRSQGGSGLKPWTPQWSDWCKAHYRSFNEATGMVLTFSGETKLCP